MSSRSRNDKSTAPADKLTRIAIVSNDKCKPKRCRQECKKSCPVVRMGKFTFLEKMISKNGLIYNRRCNSF